MTDAATQPLVSRCREIVTIAATLSSARYSFETKAEGDFWHGRCLVSIGKRQFSGDATMRSPEKSIAAAMINVAKAILVFEEFQ